MYQNAIAGTQYINQSTYRLAVIGLVNNTLSDTYDQVVNSYQHVQKVVTITCVEGWSAQSFGKAFRSMTFCRTQASARKQQPLFSTLQTATALRLAELYCSKRHYAWVQKMNNGLLTAPIGWPFMLICQDKYGNKWIKWITQIEASNDSSYLGYGKAEATPTTPRSPKISTNPEFIH